MLPASLPKQSAHKRLLRQIEGLGYRGLGLRLFSRVSSLPKQCSLLSGRTFLIEGEDSIDVGLCPLILQALQNNYSSGIRRISFSTVDGAFLISIQEEDCSHILPVGFSKAEYSTVDMHAEPYIVGTYGSFSTDEDDNLVLKSRILVRLKHPLPE